MTSNHAIATRLLANTRCGICAGKGCSRCSSGFSFNTVQSLNNLRDLLNAVASEIKVESMTKRDQPLIDIVYEMIERQSNRRVPRLPENRFVKDYGFDSLDNIEFVMDLEEACGIEIDDDEMHSLDDATVAELLSFLERKGVTGVI